MYNVVSEMYNDASEKITRPIRITTRREKYDATKNATSLK
jgi:hypothetical protein